MSLSISFGSINPNLPPDIQKLQAKKNAVVKKVFISLLFEIVFLLLFHFTRDYRQYRKQFSIKGVIFWFAFLLTIIFLVLLIIYSIEMIKLLYS